MIGHLLCQLGLHKYEIIQVIYYVRGKREQKEFRRICDRKGCMIQQSLQRPKEYHPTKYVWTKVDPSKY